MMHVEVKRLGAFCTIFCISTRILDNTWMTIPEVFTIPDHITTSNFAWGLTWNSKQRSRNLYISLAIPASFSETRTVAAGRRRAETFGFRWTELSSGTLIWCKWHNEHINSEAVLLGTCFQLKNAKYFSSQCMTAHPCDVSVTHPRMSHGNNANTTATNKSAAESIMNTGQIVQYTHI